MNYLAFATVLCFAAVCAFSGVDAQATGALMCYNCTHTMVLGFEAGQRGCKDPFSESGISQIACDGSCVKRVLEGDIPTVMRTCQTTQEGECVELNKFKVSQGNYVTQKCCSGNLCNGAGALAFNLLVAIAALGGALAIKY